MVRDPGWNLGFGGLGFRGLGFRGLGFRGFVYKSFGKRLRLYNTGFCRFKRTLIRI